MVWSISIPPIPKNNQLPKNSHKSDGSAHLVIKFWELSLFFWIWNGTAIFLARRTRVVPGELTHCMSKKHASSTSRTYAHGMADGLHQATTRTPPNAWAVRRCHANARPPKAGKSHAAVSWQGADATSMTHPCFVDCCSMLMRVLRVLLCFCCRRERSAKKVVVLWALGRVTAPHAQRTARPTHALHNTPRWRRLD